MKKLYLIGILMILIIGMLITSVYAVTATISFNGEDKVEPGSTNKIAVHITSDDTIGGIEGKIVTSSNISKLTTDNVYGKNGWLITAYDPETGVFNALKVTGTKEEDIFEIEYTVENQEGQAKIELKDLKIVNTNYEEGDIEDVSKTISIANKQSGESDDGHNNQVPSQNTSGQNTSAQNISRQNVTSNSTETVAKGSKNIPTTKSDAVLPKAGILNVIIPVVVLTIIVALVSYFGYKKYKEIN